MGKLLKAGAEARHFLAQFRSLTKVAELLDDASGLDGEINTLEKRKKVAEEELAKFNKGLELVNKQCAEGKKTLSALQLRIKDERKSFGDWTKKAESAKEKIISDTVRLQAALKELRVKLGL